MKDSQGYNAVFFERIMNILSELEKRPFVSLMALLGFSLLIKAVLIYQADIINTDGIVFTSAARELFRGDIVASFNSYPMIGYSFVLGLVQLVVRDWFLAGKILSCLSLLLATIPLYLITCDLFNKKAAFFTALVFTIAPSVNGKCTAVIRDPFFMLLVTLSLWLVLYAIRESRYGFFLTSSLLCCFSVLVRSEGAILFLAILFFLVVSAIFISEGRSFNVKCLAAFCFLPFCGLLLISVLVAGGEIPQEHIQKFLSRYLSYLKMDHLKIYKSIYAHLKEVELDFPGGRIPNDFFEYARYNIYLVYLIGMMQTFVKDLFPLFVIPLVYGLNLKKQWTRRIALLLMVLCSFFMMDYFFLITRNFITSRYMFVPLVLSFILVGHGLDRMVAHSNRARLRTTVVFILAILCVALPANKVLSKSSGEKKEIKMAGVWLSDNRDMSQTKIIFNEESIAYHAGLFRGEYDLFTQKKRIQIKQHNQLKELDKIAFTEGQKIVVVYLDNEQVDKDSDFKHYELIKYFPGRKKTVMIYERKK